MEAEGHICGVALEEKTRLLIPSIEAGDVDHAMRQMLAFNAGRNSNFYRQIGKITRGLHSAIGNPEIRNDDVSDHHRDMHERLSHVIDLTADAANQTMDLAEEALPVFNALRDESARLAVDWEKLRNRELTVEDVRAPYIEMSNFLNYATIESALASRVRRDCIGSELPRFK
ncbi:MAG: chemotaxis protein CheZ [Candidatus Pseudothioglobus sp.]|jgi:chemotaxis protein CheZ